MNFKETYNRENYIKFFRDNLLPEDFEVNIENIELDFPSKHFTKVTLLGKSEELDLGVYEVKHDSANDARNSLSIDAFKLVNKYEQNNILILFVPKNPDNYRLSIISSITEFDNKGINLIKTRSNIKRYSYFLGKGAKVRTPEHYLFGKITNRVIDIEDLKNRFSVDVVVKEFFNKYKTQYQKFVDYLVVSNFRTVFFNNNDKAIRDFVKKMMGRIIFLYFLQKKGWLGASSEEYNDGDKNFMNNFWENSGKGEAFYSVHLAKLFFEGLNLNNRDHDLFELPNGKKVKVPFLNGGLFEEEKTEFRNLTFPPELMEELFKFLGEYNFTIDENDPYEQEVGIDPEMLGHIFENLLEDNKDKGAYYTPKEIVQYMTQESLIDYIKTGFEKNSIDLSDSENASIENLVKHKDIINLVSDLEPTHEQLLDSHNQSKLIKKYGPILNQLLDEVKICDPAIGSGAFPMGMLNEIYQCKLAIDNSLTSSERANVKKHIIENSIYGVDIEKGAVDIARLRFWLALVIEEERPCTLPNLDYKIVVGNSLLSTFENENIIIDWNLKSAGTGKMIAADMRKKLKELTIKQKEFFTSADKSKLKQDIRNLKIEILEKNIAFYQKNFHKNSVQQTEMYSKNAVKKVTNKIEAISFGRLLERLKTLKYFQEKDFNHFDWKLDFPEILNPEIAGDNPGFDIVIGNPPYLRIQGIKKDNSKLAETLSKTYESATGSYDLYSVFTEKALELTKESGILNFIMPVKWTNAAFGKGLRKLVSKRNAANRIISFGAYQVFNASTYTGLHWFKRDSKHLKYVELDKNLKSNIELKNYLYSLDNFSYSETSNSKIDESQWTLTDRATSKIIDLLSKQSKTIDSCFERIFQGIATSKDDVYFLFNCTENEHTITGYSKHLGETIEIEKGLLKPLLKGNDVHRYERLNTNKYVLFPYQLLKEGGKDKAIPYTEDDIKTLFPLGHEYILNCEDAIKGREKGRLSNDSTWFRYIYPKNLVLFQNEKLMAPDISLGGNFTYDKEGEFYSTTTIYGYIKRKETKEDYRFFMAILNSKLMWWFLVNTGTTLANGYFRFKPDYLKPFPIPELKNLEIENAFIRLVDYITFLKSLPEGQQINEYVPNSHIIGIFEELVDAMVFELYFPNQMAEANISFINHVQETIVPLPWNEIESKEKGSMVHTVYQMLRTDNNILRNNIKLLDIRLESIIKPIKSI